ncbi:MAG: hypothetical protein JXQ81_11085 [Desulfuromonadales bacterium]|nr:hypothetical protein [Desulfuromonadales bacterium]MBN2793042.1 hypothetical protein [Desulfuromonadales bacterium]
MSQFITRGKFAIFAVLREIGNPRLSLHNHWIPAFAGMTSFQLHTLNTVILKRAAPPHVTLECAPPHVTPECFYRGSMALTAGFPSPIQAKPLC